MNRISQFVVTAETESVVDDLPDDVPALLQKAKHCVANEDVVLALRCYQKANLLEPSDKLDRRIDRMKVCVLRE